MTIAPDAAPPTPDASPIEASRPDAATKPILVLCDHATNQVPRALGDLGLPPDERARHIAWDPGARAVATAIAGSLGAAYLGTTFSRLVVDPNRGESDPTLIMRLYDRTIIPGNARVDAAERERRLDALHRPYHRAIDATRAALARRFGREPLLVSIHSFTPQLRGGPPRPWPISVLWAGDAATAQALLAMLRAEITDAPVGDNEPYRGALPGDTMDRHGDQTGAPHVLLELRQDEISDPARAAAWAARLAPMIARLVDDESVEKR